MTGPREAAVLEAQAALVGSSALERVVGALEAIAAAMAAEADMHEFELSCMAAADEDDEAQDGARAN